MVIGPFYVSGCNYSGEQTAWNVNIKMKQWAGGMDGSTELAEDKLVCPCATTQAVGTPQERPFGHLYPYSLNNLSSHP